MAPERKGSASVDKLKTMREKQIIYLFVDIPNMKEHLFEDNK